MKTPDFSKKGTQPKQDTAFGEVISSPGLLVAFAPGRSVSTDRVTIQSTLTIGRDPRCDLSIADSLVSREHSRITTADGELLIEDLNSYNGTFVSGYKVKQRQKVIHGDVIRIGDAILVFQNDVESLAVAPPKTATEFVGRFYTGAICKELGAGATTGQPLLIAGPSGSGKELLVRHLVSIHTSGKKKIPFVSHNMARFTSEAEIVSTLFGVGTGVFSSVEARPGLIEQADGGVLFLDEVHNLPQRVQRSLLKIVEDGEFSRIGESKKRRVEVRFVMASNSADADFGLAHDLLARLYLITVPSLKERVADIPCIFEHLLERALAKHQVDAEGIKQAINADHFEALCLDGFADDNVRGIDQLVNRLVAKVAAGDPPKSTVVQLFSERFAAGPVARRYQASQKSQPPNKSNSNYEANKSLIIEIFRQCEGSITATKKVLDERGVACSRRWLSIFLDRWGVRR